MDKYEVLSRAWIDCDPNRAGRPRGSGWHADDVMQGYTTAEIKNAKDEVIGAYSNGVSEELSGAPRWRWFLPRAVMLEDYLERHGFVIVKMEQVSPSPTGAKDNG